MKRTYSYKEQVKIKKLRYDLDVLPADKVIQNVELFKTFLRAKFKKKYYQNSFEANRALKTAISDYRMYFAWFDCQIHFKRMSSLKDSINSLYIVKCTEQLSTDDHYYFKTLKGWRQRERRQVIKRKH